MVCIVGINFKYVVYFVFLLGLKGRIMNTGVLKGTVITFVTTNFHCLKVP